ncbi:GNAT family N-acetyltransferase [Paenibacillus aquistagni]|uniref:Protein N-acetyltransferase, RimJ/RimL family n=1 Tax=Paenibacillus aquistagni TaxID=1852522 RepID=A0A1X7LIS7_9BACL|nr:GNAT family N-acetyltransferase [Paenibacillus aquistagni]SMG53761.1 Protein N-acetyltransferase, RimJ/RimL family [Paenibacillus aquistagni]
MDHSYRILSPRLLLRPLTEHDLEVIRTWPNHASTRIWFHDYQPIDIDRAVNDYERYRLNERDMMFVAVWMEQELAIGTASLSRIDLTMRTAELGKVYIGSPEAQGLSFGEEMVSALTAFGIGTLGLKQLELYVKVTNTRAIRVYMNCGYVHDRSYRHHRVKGATSSLIRMVYTVPRKRSIDASESQG